MSTLPPGLPPGGSFTSNPAGGFPPGGSFSSEPLPPEATAWNLSGYPTNYANKLATKPPGIEEIDGYTESWGPDGQEVVRMYKVPWNVKDWFRQWALGYSWNQAGTLRRITPIQHPLFTNLFCVKLDMERGLGALGKDQIALGLDPPQDLPAYYNNDPVSGGYGFAVFKATFRNLRFRIRSDDDQQAGDINGVPLTENHRYVEREERDAQAGQTIPNGTTIRFDDPLLDPRQNQNLTPGQKDLFDAIISTAGILKLYPTKEVHYIWCEVPDVPEEAIIDCTGGVNADAFDLPWIAPIPQGVPPIQAFNFASAQGLAFPVGVPQGGGQLVAGVPVGGALSGYGYAPETMLMLPAQKEEYVNAALRICWRIRYQFLFRPQGWNSFPAIDGNFYHASVFDRAGNATPFYKPKNFNNLWTQPVTNKRYLNALY